MAVKDIFNCGADVLRKINAYLSKARCRRDFRKKFVTSICPRSCFDLSIVRAVGRYSYGDLNIISYGNKDESLEIGEFVSIASDVVFHMGGMHPLDTLTTLPFEFVVLGIPGDPTMNLSKGPIIVHDDVWIGSRALILSGVEIGQGAVIGAGSVVAKPIPPYAVAVGNPARVIKYRFSPEIIDVLCRRLNYRMLTEDIVRKIHPILKMPLNRERLEEILAAMGC